MFCENKQTGTLNVYNGKIDHVIMVNAIKFKTIKGSCTKEYRDTSMADIINYPLDHGQGQIQSSGFLRIFTYTDDWLF